MPIIGTTMLDDESVEMFNKLLQEDSNNINKWNLKSVIGYKPNRLISYPCNYFHFQVNEVDNFWVAPPLRFMKAN